MCNIGTKNKIEENICFIFQGIMGELHQKIVWMQTMDKLPKKLRK